MSTILEPVIQLEKQLDEAKQTAIATLLQQRGEIDEQLTQLGYGVKKRGRPTKQN